MDECPVLAIAISEFDIDKGNTLSSFWPPRFDWSKFEESNIADLCLPDGGHLHPEDWTYLILHLKPNVSSLSTAPSSKLKPKKADQGRASTTSLMPSVPALNTVGISEMGIRSRADSIGVSPRVSGSPRKSDSASLAHDSGLDDTLSSNHADGPYHDLIFGIAMFQNKPDKTVRRGAIQKSLLLLSKTPIFHVYQDILRHTLSYIINSGDKNILKVLFDTLRSSWGQKEYKILDKSFPYSPPQLAQDEFGSASLKELVQRFGVDTMYLWYTMLLQQRILFSGQPAHLVGECCLACPLLVGPLTGFSRNISPYVALTDISPLERPHYICGTTNAIFETHTQRYDMMASFSTGIVRKSNAKLSAMDKEFILNVISGMGSKGEKWIRDQFFNYTKNFLDSVANNTYKSPQHRALGEPFRLSQLYEDYLASLKSATPTGNANSSTENLSSVMTTLHQGATGQTTLNDAKVKQLLWDLLQKLVDLNTIDDVCEKDILAIIAPLLDSNSAQVRKYAVATLAQIAISIKGQVSLIRHNLIPRVVLMLRDPMPNVASAAAYCLFKISSLFIGVTALVQHRVPKMLLNIICSSDDNLTLKISTAETLLQIHRLDPTCPIIGHENIKVMLRHTSDVTFRNVLILLLDLWGEARLPIKTAEAVEVHLASLRAGGLDIRTGATSMLLSSVAQDRNLLLQIVAAGGVQTVLKNLTGTPREEPLARLSMAILCLVCDTSMGRSSLLGYKAIETVLQEFNETDFPLHLYYVCRFCEVACQYANTTEAFLESKGLDQLVTTVCKYAEKPLLKTLAMPCLGALKYLPLLNPMLLADHPELVTVFRPIADIYVRFTRKSYENLCQTGHPAVKSTGSPVEAVLASLSFEEKEFFQLLGSVVTMWCPQTAEKMTQSQIYSETNDSVPAIDDALRLASEKLVSLIATRTSKRPSSRRGTIGGSPSSARGLTSISEIGTPVETPRSNPNADDLMSVADSILADLDSTPSTARKSPTSSRKDSPSTHSSPPMTPIDSSREVNHQPQQTQNTANKMLDNMDEDVDQLLAELADTRIVRSRSATGTDLDLLASTLGASIDSVKGDTVGKSSLGHSTDSVSSQPGNSASSTTDPAALKNDSTKLSSPRGFGSSLGGSVGASSLTTDPTGRKLPMIPNLNVADMWDDIADLSSAILGEALLESPHTPTPQQDSSPRSSTSAPSALNPLHQSAPSTVTDREHSMSPKLKPVSGPGSPADSPTSSPRSKKSSPRLESLDNAPVVSPVTRRASRRSISPRRAKALLEEDDSPARLDSPKKKNRRSIQITSPIDDSLEATLAELEFSTSAASTARTIDSNESMTPHTDRSGLSSLPSPSPRHEVGEVKKLRRKSSSRKEKDKDNIGSSDGSKDKEKLKEKEKSKEKKKEKVKS